MSAENEVHYFIESERNEDDIALGATYIRLLARFNALGGNIFGFNFLLSELMISSMQSCLVEEYVEDVLTKFVQGVHVKADVPIGDEDVKNVVLELTPQFRGIVDEIIERNDQKG